MKRIENISNKQVNYCIELNCYKKKTTKELLLRTLSCIAVLIAGITSLIFFGKKFLALGVALIFISSFALYQYLNYYIYAKNTLGLARLAIKNNV